MGIALLQHKIKHLQDHKEHEETSIYPPFRLHWMWTTSVAYMRFDMVGIKGSVRAASLVMFL